MPSTFGILETARSGLNASQLGLSITSQNTANASNTGYTRQTIDSSSKAPDTGAYRNSPSNGQVGQGVSIDGVTQIRDSFLDVRYRYENSSYNLYGTTQSLMKQIEDQFNEIGSTTSSDNKLTGLSGMIDTIISDLQKGSTADSTTSSTISTTIEGDISTIISSINSDASFLKDALASANKELNIYVNGGSGDTSVGGSDNGVNGIIKDIQSLNQEISSYEVTGQKANDLRDERNSLLDTLSSYVDIDTKELPNGMVTVQLKADSEKGDNQYIVSSDNEANQFRIGDYKSTLKDDKGNVTGTTTNTVLKWGDHLAADGSVKSKAPDDTDTTPPALVEGGIVKGYLNVINGDGTGASDPATGKCGDVGIKSLITKLNDFATSFASIMNGTNDKSSSLIKNNGSNTNINGDTFITFKKSDGSESATCDDPTQAASEISVSSKWASDKTEFLTNYKGSDASSYFNAYIADLGGSTASNNPNTTGTVSQTSTTGGSATIFNGTFSQFADSFTQEIANAVNDVTKKGSAAQTSAKNLDNQRQSISGVSTNDEAVNLIKYQQAYNANSRVITAIDQMLDKLINSTGTVGIS